MSFILGLNCSGLHSSACLVEDGRVLHAICEERLTRVKQDRSFPHRAIAYCCEAAGVEMTDISDVYVGWNPRFYIQQSDRTLTESFRQRGKVSYLALNELATGFQGEIEGILQTIVRPDGELAIHFVDHHRAHVAGAFFLSGFDRAAFLVLDGFGETSSGMAGAMRPDAFCVSSQYRTPHSLGAFYSTFADFLGFSPNSEEWKVMALAAFGDPERYSTQVRSLVRVSESGFELDLSFFEHFLFFTPTFYAPKFCQTFGAPRARSDNLEQHHFDLMAAAQLVVEESIFDLLTRLHAATQEDDLVVGGGLFMNSVCNGKLLERTPFTRVFVGGSPDDSGISLGSALHGAQAQSELQRPFCVGHNFFGKQYATEDTRSYLEARKLRYSEAENPAVEAARLLMDGKIIGWFQGASEFGQRALGNRSILADPTRAGARDMVNSEVKYREWFRPFGGAVPEERQAEFFDLRGHRAVPFMECVVDIKGPWTDRLPGITHVDGSSRLQSVSQSANPDFHRLLLEFEKLSGVPILLNTSFNTRGMPLVETPEDAISCFFTSGLDALVIDRFVLVK